MSLNTQLAAFIDALVEQGATALEALDVLVTDCYGITSDPGDFLMIGVEEPSLSTAASSGAADQNPATMGNLRTRDETGSVTCAAFSENGDANIKVARDTAFSFVEALAAMVREDPSLGIAEGSLFVAGPPINIRLLQNQDQNGASALVIFTMPFRARL